jgi:glutamate N-acetyltransferase/amino-acid N-acetyltransferase
VTKIEGGVTAAKGFSAASTAAKIKYEGRTDMAMIYSASPCTCAGTFTRNVVKAAPVIWDRDLVQSGKPMHAVVVNSGIANACTGQEGLDYCRQTAEAAASCLNIPADSVLVGSTGVIGFQLPMDVILEGVAKLIPELAGSRQAALDASEAILTTDTHKKEIAVEFQVGGVTCTMGAMSKGSGVIHPNMGTMLCYLTTDCAVDSVTLKKVLKEVCDVTFNRISVDGDTSTNDTLLIMAKAEAGYDMITDKGDDYNAFKEAGLTADMDKADICEKMIETVTGGFSYDGLTGSGMTWNEKGEVNKEPAVCIIKDAKYVDVQ